MRASRLTRFQWHVLGGVLLTLCPLLLIAIILIVLPLPPLARWTLLGVALLASAALLRWHLRRVTRPLSTLASLLEALREGDYTLRGVPGGALGQVIYDVNALAQRLQSERVRFEEASHLLSKTLAALDSAVFVFDDAARLSLVNPAGQRLLQAKSAALFGHSDDELGLHDLFAAASGSVITQTFPGRSGRFEIRHAALRQEGRGGRLLVINDVDRVLRDEERQAWQRLLRVLGHEVNNSLAPIRSIAGTLTTLTTREPLPVDWHGDLRDGLALIERRAAALTRFLAGYSQLARLPPPQRRALDLGALLRSVARLESGAAVQMDAGTALHVQADADQIEQALINLLRNAAEAVPAQHGEVRVRCWREADRAVVEIIDNGPGPPPSANLFVPFFTTKPGGSGIGLALARQIAEAHGGGVALSARSDASGAVARLWISLGNDMADSG
ncbi:two-component system sensor histidine kinase [mine drainage metagenome]|uniref:histidine kinase n=1 Tax=mine drainage metagenome TaxID=410659 RepID=T1C0N1_9ZZZZ